jgi:hypothetical protein
MEINISVAAFIFKVSGYRKRDELLIIKNISGEQG